MFAGLWPGLNFVKYDRVFNSYQNVNIKMKILRAVRFVVAVTCVNINIPLLYI